MQTLVDAIRATGATQPIMVGGLDYANDLTPVGRRTRPTTRSTRRRRRSTTTWARTATTSRCWNSEIAPVAANVPVVTGEFDEDNYHEPKCADQDAVDVRQRLHELGRRSTASATWPGAGWCSPRTRRTRGLQRLLPAQQLRRHARARRTAPRCTITATLRWRRPPADLRRAGSPAHDDHASRRSNAQARSRRRVKPGGSQRRLHVALRAELRRHADRPDGQQLRGDERQATSATRCRWASVRFSLKAGKTKTVVLKLSKASRKLLAAKRRSRCRSRSRWPSAGHSPHGPAPDGHAESAEQAPEQALALRCCARRSYAARAPSRQQPAPVTR